MDNSILLEFSHCYKIRHMPTGKIYVGVVIKQGKTMFDRLSEHICGVGSLGIKELNDPDLSNYSLELIDWFVNVDECYDRELEEIKLIPHELKLNKNGGGGFRPKSFFMRSSLKDKQYCHKLIEENNFNSPPKSKSINNSIIQKFRNNLSVLDMVGFFDYSEIRKLRLYGYSTESIFGIKRYCKSNNSDISEFIEDDTYKQTRVNSINRYFKNGILPKVNTASKRNLFFDEFFSKKHAKISIIKLIGHSAGNKNPADTDGWKKGREKFRKRKSMGIHTDAELEIMKHRSDITKKAWGKTPPHIRKIRTENGLNSMNTKTETCSVCGKSGLGKGNLKRWHNENCKHKED